MKKLKIGLVVLLFLMCKISSAQFYFFYNEEAITLNKQLIKAFVDSSTEHNTDRYYEIEKKFKSLDSLDIQLNFTNEMLWLKIPLDILPSNILLDKIMIRNPHINYVKFWILKNDTIVTSYDLTGDHLNFNTRFVKHPDFIYPINFESRNKLAVVILIDKRNEQLNIPIHFLSEKGLTEFNQKIYITIGLITGAALFLLAFSFFLFLNFKELVYLFYCFYLITSYLYIFCDIGFGFMYLFPNTPIFSDLSRPIFICLANPIYLIFILRLLDVKTHLPKLFSFSTKYLIIYFLLFVVSIAFMQMNNLVRVYLLLTMQVLQYITIAIMILIAVVSIKKQVLYSKYIFSNQFFITYWLLRLYSFSFREFNRYFSYSKFDQFFICI